MNRHFGTYRNKAAVKHPKKARNFLGLLRPSSSSRLPVKAAINAPQTLVLPLRPKPQEQCDTEVQSCLRIASTPSSTIPSSTLPSSTLPSSTLPSSTLPSSTPPSTISSTTASSPYEHHLDCQLFPGAIDFSLNPNVLVDELIPKWISTLSRYLRAATGRDNRISGGGNASSLQGDGSSFSALPITNANNGKGKGNGGGGGGGGGGKKRPPNGSPDKEHTKKTRHGTPTVKRWFACPFYKHDPLQHQRCATFKARSVADVRQHVQRPVHPQQPLHCPVCKTKFTDIANPNLQRLRDVHVRARACSPNSITIPGITFDQVGRIRASQPRTQPTEETWFKIWDILFPNDNRPDSPYLEAGLGGMVQTLTAIYLDSSPRDKLPLGAIPHLGIILNHFVSFWSNMPVTNFGTQPQHDQATTTTATSTRTTTTTATARTAPMGTTVQSITTGSTGMVEYTNNGQWHLIPGPFAEQNPQHTDQNQVLNPASNQFPHHQYPVLETTQHLTPGSPSDVLEPHYAETGQDRSYFFDGFTPGTPTFEGIGSMLDLPAYFPPTNFQNEDRFHGNT
ncbi:hypothetical protein EDB81DRAFT_950084 [Dactylonectria macrodidyma]|uniref:C2H2-type domain-containing protein n=1 Tax=Dactylonectria macrodidyma TaxID=307937 RepID=A0A9P9EA19_9HYPO|nr:hypothetical protein EDB81DRAFT_950084 [Dactylonectria macrodidyma]